MKLLRSILAIFPAILLFSCGNGSDKEEAKTADTTAAVAAEPAVVKPAFIPFKVVVIQHKVKNFDKAKSGYFNSDSIRSAYGITHFVMGRDLKDSNTIFVMDKIEDMDKAKSFFTSPKVKTAMMKAGVSSAPGYSYAEIIRLNDAPAATDLRLAVSHHVKDFAAWEKAFDAEGASTRAANGVIDLALARNLYDSNTVHVFFVVSDMAKAKARMATPEFKKMIADAGVDSAPTIRWYKEVK